MWFPLADIFRGIWYCSHHESYFRMFNGAITGDATIASPLPININWHLESTGGTFTDATVNLEGSEIEFTNTIAQSALQARCIFKVTSTAFFRKYNCCKQLEP